MQRFASRTDGEKSRAHRRQDPLSRKARQNLQNVDALSVSKNLGSKINRFIHARAVGSRSSHARFQVPVAVEPLETNGRGSSVVHVQVEVQCKPVIQEKMFAVVIVTAYSKRTKRAES